MTAKEAFDDLLKDKPRWRSLGDSRITRSHWKRRYMNGELSYKKMYEILDLAGYNLISERKYEKTNR